MEIIEGIGINYNWRKFDRLKRNNSNSEVLVI